MRSLPRFRPAQTDENVRHARGTRRHRPTRSRPRSTGATLDVRWPGRHRPVPTRRQPRCRRSEPVQHESVRPRAPPALRRESPRRDAPCHAPARSVRRQIGRGFVPRLHGAHEPLPTAASRFRVRGAPLPDERVAPGPLRLPNARSRESTQAPQRPRRDERDLRGVGFRATARVGLPGWRCGAPPR